MPRQPKREGLFKTVYDEQQKTLDQGFATTADLIRIVANHRWFDPKHDICDVFKNAVPFDRARMTKEQFATARAAWDEIHQFRRWISAKWPSWQQHLEIVDALYYACPYRSVTWDECRNASVGIFKNWDNRFTLAEAFVNGD